MFSVNDSPEETVDSGHVYVSLDPGERKRLDVFLGRIEALEQKLREMREQVAWVKITVESVEFADGSQWDANSRGGGERAQLAGIDLPGDVG